jgi:anti-sigma factor RsiW
MDCKKAERLLLWSFDERLEVGEKAWLRDHLAGCPRCQRVEREYRMIFGSLKEDSAPEPLPYFEQRLLTKLRERERVLPGLVWQRLAVRALAFSLSATLLIGGALFVFRPREAPQLSQVEALLLRDENPLVETQNILNAQGPENNMMLIFTAMDEKEAVRR